MACTTKWLEISQTLGTATFCRTSSFHRNFHRVSRSNRHRFGTKPAPSSQKNHGSPGLTRKLPRLTVRRRLNRAWTAQNSCGKEKKCREQSEITVHRDTNDAERQCDEPNDGEQHNCQHSQRPAEDKQDAPEKKCGHVRSPDTSYARDARKVSLGPVAY